MNEQNTKKNKTNNCIFDNNNISLSHIFSLTLNIDKVNILLQTMANFGVCLIKLTKYLFKIEKTFKTQIGLESMNTELFLIYGYNQNPQLSYLYFIGSQTSLFHRSKKAFFKSFKSKFLDLLKDASSFCSNLMDFENFLLPQKDDIHLEPTPLTKPSFVSNQDNISLVLKIDIDLIANVKVYKN